MSTCPGPLVRSFETWRDAQARASGAEIAVLRAHIAYCRGAGALPPRELTQEARELRLEASSLLAAALREMRQASGALRWPPAAEPAREQSGTG